jgi:hypothetical protein
VNRAMLRGAFVAVACLTLAACNSSRQIAPGVTAASADQPVTPGTTRFTLNNPDPEKWVARVRQGAPDGSVRYGYTCKVLACPDPATIIVTSSRSPTARPDPKALEKLAKESIPKLTQAENLQLQVRTDNKAKAETLSGSVTKVGEFPAIFNEMKLSVQDRSRFIAIKTVFAGKMLVNIRAEAADRATAKTAVEDFSRSFKVEEGPPVQGG